MTNPPPPPPTPPPAPSAPAGDTRTWVLLTHLSQLVLGFVGPLAAYLIKKDEDPVVAEHARETLNFQLSMLIWYVLSFVLVFVIIGFVLFAGLVVVAIVFPIIGAVRASNGELWRYPLTIRMVS